MDVVSLFSDAARPPSFYNITFDVENAEALFKRILEIYKYGATHLFTDDESINIMSLNERRRLVLKEYMMSIGINPSVEIYTPEDVHQIYKDMLYEFSNIPPIVSPDGIEERLNAQGVVKNGKYVSINLAIPKQYDILAEFIRIIDGNRAYKDLLDVYPKKTELSDFRFKILLKNNVSGVPAGTIYTLLGSYPLGETL